VLTSGQSRSKEQSYKALRPMICKTKTVQKNNLIEIVEVVKLATYLLSSLIAACLGTVY